MSHNNNKKHNKSALRVRREQEFEQVREALLNNVETLFRKFWGEPIRPGATQWRAKESSSQAMTVRGQRAGFWKNFRTNEGGDILDFVAVHALGLSRARDDFRATILEGARLTGVSVDDAAAPNVEFLQRKRAARQAEQAKAEIAEAEKKRKLVAELVGQARPADGSAAAEYLRGRGVDQIPGCFEYLPAVPGARVLHNDYDALIVWGTDADGNRRGGQRILIDRNGKPAEIETRKPAFGEIGGFPARLPGRGEGPLVVAEGPETAASIWMATGLETWAVYGVSGFASAPLPLGRQIIFAPDQDGSDSPAGKQFAAACKAHAEAGADLWIARAPEPEGSKNDLNDTLIRAGANAVQEAIAGAQAYTLRDTRGRFKGAGAVATDTPASAPAFQSVESARQAVRQEIEEFLAEAAAWDETCPEPAPVLAIKATQGVGKSTIAREVLGTFDLNHFSGDAVFYAPTLALAEEAAAHAAELDTSGHVTRGRAAVNPAGQGGERMCQRHELADQVMRAGLQIKPTICRRINYDGETVECPHASGCAYLMQWYFLRSQNELRFESSQYLTLSGDGSARELGLRVVDESIWRLFTRTADIPLDVWTRLRSGDGLKSRNKQQQAAAEELAIDATAVSLQVLAALQAGRSPLSIANDAGEAYSAEIFRELAKIERGPDILGGGPDDSTDELSERIAEHGGAADPHAGSRAALWSVLADCVERELETTERVRLVRGVPAPGTGEIRDVIRVTWLAEAPRNVPVLLLDADADPVILDRLYPGARIASFEVEPNAHVVQLTDRTFSKSSLDKPTNRTEVAALVRSEVYRDKLDGERGVLAIASREVVKWMFEDAGHDLSDMDQDQASEFMRETVLHGARWLWFGPASLGRNDWKDFGTALVIGREELPVQVLEDQGRALFGDSSEPLSFVEPEERGLVLMPQQMLAVTMRDGSSWATRGRAHPDSRIRAIQGQSRECAARQAIERLRLVNADRQKRVVIASAVPVPSLPVDELKSWDQLKPTRFEAAMAEAALNNGGILRLSAAGLAADAPMTFGSAKAAERWIAKDGAEQIKYPLTANNDSITRGGVLKPIRLSLRCEGQRGRAVQALALLPGAPRKLAEAVLGVLSSCEVVEDPNLAQQPASPVSIASVIERLAVRDVDFVDVPVRETGADWQIVEQPFSAANPRKG